MKHTNRAFVALISAIVISAVLLALVFAASSLQFSARSDVLNNELELISQNLVDACINIAMQKISENFSYAPPPPGDTILVGENSCTIISVTYGSEDSSHEKSATIRVSATYRNISTEREIIVNVRDPDFAWPAQDSTVDITSSREITP